MPYPKPRPNKNAIRFTDDPAGVFVTPVRGAGSVRERVDRGYENLHVRLLSVPDINRMKRDAAIGNSAHVGGAASPLELAEMPVEQLITFGELVNSGLEQTFESEMISFLVYGCTRGFTHEMVRTRNGASYNQQTFRHTNLTGVRYRMPVELTHPDWAEREPIDEMFAQPSLQEQWLEAVEHADATYRTMVALGVPYEDARTVLPISTETYIEVRMPWRTFVDTFAYRACYMFYPEMVWVMHELYRRLRVVAPELAQMLNISCERSQTCTYRGAEPTGDGACPFVWSGRRNWVPDQNKRWEGREYFTVSQWDAAHPDLLRELRRGQRYLPDTQFDEDGIVAGGSSEWDNRA